MIRKFTAVFSAIAILLWVMPLGSFIKPSQEKTACGGSRGMHMCTMGMKASAPAERSSVVAFSNAGTFEKTQKPASTETGGVLLSDGKLWNHALSAEMRFISNLSFTSIALPPLDQVPKF